MADKDDKLGAPKPWPDVRSTFEHLTKKLEEVDPGRRADVIAYWERQLSREKKGIRSRADEQDDEGLPKPWPNVRSTFEHLTKKLEEVDPGRRADVIAYWERQLSREKKRR